VLSGEFRYPGSYAIEPGVTRLKEILDRAGGFNTDASLADAVVIRRSVLQEKDPLLERILQIDPKERTLEETDYLRVKIQERPAVMAVNFPRLMAGDEQENILLSDNDSLFAPSQKLFVKVTGKVKNPGNITYRPGRTYREYVEAAGGYGWRADDGETQIIKGKNGDTFLASSESRYDLEPGDAIFVPEEPKEDFWKGFTTALSIFAQLATVVAVVVSILR
jgi:protein involved in polysaccharide export with SLBB domain